MVVKVNGHNRDGAFQTGKHEVIVATTLHHLEATGVIATRAQLVSDGILSNATLSSSNNIVIQGVSYETDAAYDSAFWAQRNLDRVINRFAEYANLVSVDVDQTAADLGAAPGATLADPFRASSEAIGTAFNAVTDNPAWKLSVVVEQKGVFNGVPVTSTTKGQPTLGASADNYGTSVTSLASLFDGLVLTRTAEDDTYADVIGAGDPGDDFTVVTSAGTAANVSMVFEVDVAPDLQS